MSETFLKILVMLLATNGAPVIAARVFLSHYAWPVDMGRRLHDGHPIFGSSKTWRGLISAVLTSCMLAIFFGYGILFGLLFGVLVMTGDLITSFVKRRKGLEPSAQCIGWDQVPESIIAAFYATIFLGIDWWWAILLTLAFGLVQMLISRPLFWLHIRKRPY